MREICKKIAVLLKPDQKKHLLLLFFAMLLGAFLETLSVTLVLSLIHISSGFGVGSHVCVWGRVQSREYTKKLSETECEKRVAYEVSVSKLECVEE